MNNWELVFGYAFVFVLYGAYWVTLKLRLAKLEKKVGK